MKNLIYLFLTLLLVSYQAATAQTAGMKDVPGKGESFMQNVYSFVNFFNEDQFLKSIHPEPNTYYYTDCHLCNTYPVDYVKEFLHRLRSNDTTKHYIDSLDLIYFSRQIGNPAVEFWDKNKLKTAKLNGKSKISIPLFSRNRKSAVVFVTFGEYTNAYLYSCNGESKNWEMVTLIWHDEVKAPRAADLR